MAVQPDLVRQAQAGDPAAFTKLVSTYKQRIHGTAYRMTGRRDDVEDIGQEVMLRLVSSLGQLRTVEVFETWLYRLTMNAVYDHLRRRRRSADVRMADLSEEQVSFADAAEGSRRSVIESRQAEARATVKVMLDSIPAEDRELLERKEISGLSLKELRKLYNANENALKVRLFRARKRARAAHDELTAAVAA
jgi:RNA polymerase sigma-70 factor (ECF subfamily)